MWSGLPAGAGRPCGFDHPAVVTLREEILAEASRLGFLACGVASLDPSRFGDALDTWLARGFGGTMRYLHRQAKKRKNPALIVEGAVRAVVVLDSYLPRHSADGAGRVPSAERRVPRIAKYARGRDYHLELGERLGELSRFLIERGATVARAFADAGPVPERELAARAGLGWIGKNTMLIRPGTGSFFFIGSVLTDLPLEVDRPFETDHCGTCTRCLDACPTDALVEPRTLDATRCISYLTIEHKPDPDPELARQFQGWAFGCDICNDVCPWNERFAAATDRSAYQDRGDIPLDDPDFFERLDAAGFAARFADTPLERPGLVRMRRNFATAYQSLEP